MDRIGGELEKKTNKTDCAQHIKTLEKICDKREKLIMSISQKITEKCDMTDFVTHSHTEQGKIIIN